MLCGLLKTRRNFLFRVQFYRFCLSFAMITVCSCSHVVFAILLPFFMISGCLAYLMIKDIDKKRHLEEKRAKRVEKVKQKTKNSKRNKQD